MRGKIPRDELLHDLEIKRTVRANQKAICLAQLEEDTLKEAQTNPNQILIEVPKIGDNPLVPPPRSVMDN